MISYVTIGTNDFERAAAFYDALLELVGGKRLMETDRMILYSTGGTGLALVKPADGNAATVGNGVMVALTAESNEQVDAIYAKALELGGTDEGAPGPRAGGIAYAGYFRDLDGNKLNAIIF